MARRKRLLISQFFGWATHFFGFTFLGIRMLNLSPLDYLWSSPPMTENGRMMKTTKPKGVVSNLELLTPLNSNPGGLVEMIIQLCANVKRLFLTTEYEIGGAA